MEFTVLQCKGSSWNVDVQFQKKLLLLGGRSKAVFFYLALEIKILHMVMIVILFVYFYHINICQH